VRVIAATELLFRTGEAKACLYRVNSGAVCLYEHKGAQQATIGFAFPGEGFLETHACCARAVTETEVTSLPLEALASAIGDDPEAKAKLNDAIEREFEFLRSALVDAGRERSVGAEDYADLSVPGLAGCRPLVDRVTKRVIAVEGHIEHLPSGGPIVSCAFSNTYFLPRAHMACMYKFKSPNWQCDSPQQQAIGIESGKDAPVIGSNVGCQLLRLVARTWRAPCGERGTASDLFSSCCRQLDLAVVRSDPITFRLGRRCRSTTKN